MRGTSNSGKSTFVKKYFPDHTVISSDTLRLQLTDNASNQTINKQVFKMINDILEIRIHAGCPLTVIDATNLKFKDIKEYDELARRYGKQLVVLSIMPPPLVDLIHRNALRHTLDDKNVLMNINTLERHLNAYRSSTGRFRQIETQRTKEQYFYFIEFNTKDSFKAFNRVKDLFNSRIKLQPEHANDGREYFLVGDPHGCLTELKRLEQKVISNNHPNAHFIILGDLIDRGPDSIELVQYVMNNQDRYSIILGNHEHNFIAEYYGKTISSKERAITHDKLRNLEHAEQEKIIDYLKHQPYMLTLLDKNSNVMNVIMHAPSEEFNTGWHSCDNDTYTFLVGKVSYKSLCMGRFQMSVEQFNKNYVNKTKSIKSTKLDPNIFFYHGHQSWTYEPIAVQCEKNKEYDMKIFNLDSNCVYGKHLTAMRMGEPNIYYQVESEYNYEFTNS